MQWGILGPLRVQNADGESVTPSGPVRRLLLAALLSRVNTVVSAEALAVAVWGDVPPRSSAKTLQSHVVRLRDDLGREGLGTSLVTDPGGYRLVAEDGAVDGLQFERLVTIAQDAADRADHLRALTLYDEALALWRGAAYEDFPDSEFLVTERLRLAELLALAEEHRTDAALRCGRAGELVAGLERRVRETPYRERGWEQLVLALYRAGRQADALAAFARARDLLAAELGVDPGPALRGLETRILQQDPSLLDNVPAFPIHGTGAGLACPYRGLAGYGDDDAALFAGRERLVARLVALCAENTIVVVTGASGAGKSSLVRAGLVPSLRAGALPGSNAWRCVVAPPSETGAAIAGSPELLVVDQAEELFTSTSDVDRAKLVSALASHIAGGRRLVLVLRGDFYSRLAELPDLAGYVGRATLLVGPLRDDELARVVTDPALRVGLSIEPGLVDVVLDDVAGRAGALPLVSVALLRTWENRRGSLLTVAGYHAGGGVAGALEAAAEECYCALDASAAAAARRLLIRLSAREQGVWVRRRVARVVADDPATAAALDALVAARLVVVDKSTLELAHEALFEQWPRLRDWLTELEVGAELLAHVAEAAQAWQGGGRAAADLYRGSRLQTAVDWVAEHPDDVTVSESEFLAASQAAADADLRMATERADREAAARRRLRKIAVALVVVAAVAVAGGAVALVERQRAAREAGRADASALTADARRVAAEALAAPDLRTALLLAATSYRLQDSPDTRSALLTALERGGSALFQIPTHERVLWVGADASGSHLWWLDNTREAWRYDLHSRRVDAHFRIPAGTVTAVSPDGRWLVATGPRSFGDTVGPRRALVVDADTGATVAVLPTRAAGTSGVPIVFTADGRWLAVPSTTAGDGSAGAAVDLYATGDLTRVAHRLQFAAPLAGLAAGRTAVAALDDRGAVRLVDAATGRTRAQRTIASLATAAGSTAALALADDDRHVAVALPSSHVVTILDARNLAAAGHLTADQGSSVDTLAFGPSALSLAVGYDSGAVTVYGDDGTVTERTAGGSAPVHAVAWSGRASDTGLFSGGLDASVVAWDLHRGGRLLSYTGGEVPPVDLGGTNSTYFVTLSPPQGNAAEHIEQLVTIDLATHARRAWPLRLKDEESISQISVARDANVALIAVILPDRRFRYDVWDLTMGDRIASFVPTNATSVHQSFGGAVSADARTAVVSVGARRLAVVTLPAGHVRREFDVAFAGPTAGRTLAIPQAFGPDGRLLIQGFDPGQPQPDATGDPLATDRGAAVQQVAVADLRRGRVDAAASLTPLGLLNAQAWSADGRRIAIGALDGNVWLLDAHSLRVLAGPVTAASDVISTLAYSPDGSTVAVGGGDGHLTLWEGHTLRALGTPMATGSGVLPLVRFSARGGELDGLAPAADNGQRWFRVPTRPKDWVALACSIAAPALTRVEWGRYVGDRPYRNTC